MFKMYSFLHPAAFCDEWLQRSTNAWKPSTTAAVVSWRCVLTPQAATTAPVDLEPEATVSSAKVADILFVNTMTAGSSPVSIQTQSLALRALRKRKPQETQALA